ncbi:hypothetical protein JHW43_004342 [Diplocarpon mali]|nr:hypothetical protein JHW43_004342 [Diplocarpon mali]
MAAPNPLHRGHAAWTVIGGSLPTRRLPGHETHRPWEVRVAGGEVYLSDLAILVPPSRASRRGRTTVTYCRGAQRSGLPDSESFLGVRTEWHGTPRPPYPVPRASATRQHSPPPPVREAVAGGRGGGGDTSDSGHTPGRGAGGSERPVRGAAGRMHQARHKSEDRAAGAPALAPRQRSPARPLGHARGRGRWQSRAAARDPSRPPNPTKGIRARPLSLPPRPVPDRDRRRSRGEGPLPSAPHHLRDPDPDRDREAMDGRRQGSREPPRATVVARLILAGPQMHEWRGRDELPCPVGAVRVARPGGGGMVDFLQLIDIRSPPRTGRGWPGRVADPGTRPCASPSLLSTRTSEFEGSASREDGSRG